MTNKEYVINKLVKLVSLDSETVEKVYSIINARDWKIFCSYMGDYDHPYERVQAEEEMNKAFQEIAVSPEVIEVIKSNLKPDSELGAFYDKNFHNMTKEYQG